MPFVTVTDVDVFDVATVTDSNAAAAAVNENASIGTVVRITASASDANATTSAITCSLQDSDSGNFAIDSSTVVATVAAALNRETLGGTRSIAIRATSADGSFTDQTFSIAINDLDDAASGRFAIDATSGIVRVAAATLLNFAAVAPLRGKARNW